VRVLAEEGGPLRAVADIGTHWLDLVKFGHRPQVEKVCADLSTAIPIRRRPNGSVDTFQNKLASQRETELVAINTEITPRFSFTCKEDPWCFTVSQVNAGRKNCLSFEIAGSKGRWLWNSERPTNSGSATATRPTSCSSAIRLCCTRGPTFANYPGGHTRAFLIPSSKLFRAIYECIEKGICSAPFPTSPMAIARIVFCEAILRSQREQRWVRLEPSL